MSDAIIEFKNICAEIKEREKESFGYNEIEVLLLKALNHIKSNPGSKVQFLDFFSEKISSKNDELVYGEFVYLIQLIQFCMRELKWPEIYEAAKNKKKESRDRRVIGVMESIMDVYNESWTDSDLYKYYSHELNTKP